MIKKILLTATLSLLLLNSVVTPAYAAELPAPISIENPDTVLPNSEETQWIFRFNEDGVFQKRLWSLTYQEWLTDWIDVPTV